MKKLFMAAMTLSSLLAFTCTASAADPFIDPGYDWSGFYVGAHGGAAFAGGGNITELAPVPNSTDVIYNVTGANSHLGNETDFAGGIQAGYNFQVDHIVIGIEADISLIGYAVSAPQIDPETGNLLAGGDTSGSKEADVLSTLRARVGLPLDRLLVFATGGIAFSDLDYNISDTCTTTGVCGRGRLDGSKSAGIGWVAGGGVEWAITDYWLAKGEYLYANFDGESFRGNVLTVPGATARFRGDDTEFHILRVGVNFKF